MWGVFVMGRTRCRCLSVICLRLQGNLVFGLWSEFIRRSVHAVLQVPERYQIKSTWINHLRTFTWHSNFIAFLESTELAAVATERCYITALITRTAVSHPLCDAATKKTLQTPYYQSIKSALVAIRSLHPLLHHTVMRNLSFCAPATWPVSTTCLRCHTITPAVFLSSHLTANTLHEWSCQHNWKS